MNVKLIVTLLLMYAWEKDSNAKHNGAAHAMTHPHM